MVKLFAEKKVKPGLHLKERSKVKWLKKAEMIDVLLDTRESEKILLVLLRSLDFAFSEVTRTVQIIDDVNGVTLASASTIDKELKSDIAYGGNKDAAKAVGEAIAKRALAKGIEEVTFDRGGFLYHGRVKELADGAREAGLKF